MLDTLAYQVPQAWKDLPQSVLQLPGCCHPWSLSHHDPSDLGLSPDTCKSIAVVFCEGHEFVFSRSCSRDSYSLQEQFAIARVYGQAAVGDYLAQTVWHNGSMLCRIQSSRDLLMVFPGNKRRDSDLQVCYLSTASCDITTFSEG